MAKNGSSNRAKQEYKRAIRQNKLTIWSPNHLELELTASHKDTCFNSFATNTYSRTMHKSDG